MIDGNSIGQISGLIDVISTAGKAAGSTVTLTDKLVAAAPYIAAGAILGLSGNYLIPAEMKRLKIIATIGTFGLIGIGVYKILKNNTEKS